MPIVRHPNVRRMLLSQMAIAEGALALCLKGAFFQDLASHGTDQAERRATHEAREGQELEDEARVLLENFATGSRDWWRPA
ncbi:hypothetical protein [Paracoccus niistensis]|uniref:Uncharacterized protein n=1 Tax=Paracoccus niistensis TaxID=632935 RepID=A0ABV6I639_9RHOB